MAALTAALAPIAVPVSSASASTPLWEPDTNSNGPLVFYNTAGTVLTQGTNLNNLFDWAAATSAPDAGGTAATLYFAVPKSGVPTGSWTAGADPAGLSTVFPNSAAPAPITGPGFTYPVNDARGAADLGTFLSGHVGDSTAGYANMIQIRLKDKPGATRYWETDVAYNTTASPITVNGVSVPANGWAQVYPDPAGISKFVSSVAASPTSVKADGSTTSTVTVTVKTWGGTPVSGKTVTLAQGAGTSSVISAASGPSDASGHVTFTVKDSTAETAIYTATDTTDSNLVLNQTATVSFVSPPSVSAANSTVSAAPTSVLADGSTTSTVTVTLKDTSNSAVSGKTVTLAQGAGTSSVISAASGPSDASGHVTFTVKDSKVEIATYTATDTTDSVTVTQTAQVSFSQPPVANGGLTPLTPARVLNTTNGTGVPAGPVGAHQTIKLTVLGAGGVPGSGVGAVVLNVMVYQPTAGGYLTVYPDGVARPSTSNLNFVAGQQIPNLVIAPVGAGGKVDFYNGSAGTVQVFADVSGWFKSGAAAAGGLTPLTPARVLNTTNGTGVPLGAVPAHQTIKLTALGAGGVPGSGVGAVVLNVMVYQPAFRGYLTVYPDGVTRPSTSNLNFEAGEQIPNLVIAPVGADGKVDFYNGSAGTVQVFADVSGWFSSGSAAAGGLSPLTPARVLNTTNGTGVPLAAVGPNQTIKLTALGAGGVPGFGVGAVVLNVMVYQPSARGYLTVYPDGVARPSTSNLNFVAGQQIPNLVIAPVGADGKVDFYNGSAGTVQVFADVSGWFSAA